MRIFQKTKKKEKYIKILVTKYKRKNREIETSTICWISMNLVSYEDYDESFVYVLLVNDTTGVDKSP